MLATFEMQISTSTFAAGVLSALRRGPRCLPPPIAGMQVQRVRYRGATIRHDAKTSFRLWDELGKWDVGTGVLRIEDAIQPQLALDVTLDVASVAAIDANPNVLLEAQFKIDATIVFDLECNPAGSGWLELTAKISDVTAPGLLPAGVQQTWVRDQLAAGLTVPPARFDLTASLAPGRAFLNAGVAVDPTGSRLAIRAELPMGGTGEGRWTNFVRGGVKDIPGADDWSIFLRAEDLKLSLNLEASRVLGELLGDRLVTVDVEYAPQPGRAVFVMAPHVVIPVWGIERIPVSIALSVDKTIGRVVVDIDAFGLRDLIDSAVSIVSFVMKILVPILGAAVGPALRDWIAGLSHAGAELIEGGVKTAAGAAAENVEVVELPGGFRYRVSVPVPETPSVRARFSDLITTAEGVAVSGSWQVLDFTEGELAVNVSEFGWKPPTIRCGASGEAVYRDILANPKKYAALYSQIELTASGSAPVRLCDVSVLSPLDPAWRVQVSWSATRLPTMIAIDAAAALADAGLTVPLELYVRTSSGVFRAVIPPPAPLTEQDATMMRSGVKLQLQLCDSIGKPPWMGGDGKFDLNWIVNPLLDPDRANELVDLVTLQVDALLPHAMLNLTDHDGASLASAGADARGFARISVVRAPTELAPFAALEVTERFHPPVPPRPEQPETPNLAVLRQRLEVQGSLRFSEPVVGVSAAPQLGIGRFLLMQRGACYLLDASSPTHPSVEQRWRIAGLRAVAPTADGVLAFGDGGSFLLEVGNAVARAERLSREPARLVSANNRVVAVAHNDRVDLVNLYGGVESRIPVSECPVGLLALDDHLLVASATGTTMFDLEDLQQPREVGSYDDFGGLRFHRSGLDADIFGIRDDSTIVEIRVAERDIAVTATYATIPWKARAAACGTTITHLSDSFHINVFRSVPGPKLLSPADSVKMVKAAGLYPDQQPTPSPSS